MTEKIKKIKVLVAWLEKTHLNHVAIVMVLAYPTLLISQIQGGTAYNAAFTWSLAYVFREIAQTSNQTFFGSMAFWNWTFHDRIQTVYVIVFAYIAAIIYEVGGI